MGLPDKLGQKRFFYGPSGTGIPASGCGGKYREVLQPSWCCWDAPASHHRYWPWWLLFGESSKGDA